MSWSKCIVSTRKDGVSITYPTNEIMQILTCGGAPKGYLGPFTADGQIASMVERGIREDVAHKYIKHLLCGGMTDAEAYELIRDRDTNREWSGKELWDCSDIPHDRWFRDAWYRSHNGGPIEIDLSKAKPVQYRRIKSAIVDDIDAPEVDLPAIRERIRSARDLRELRSIWI